MIDSIDIHKPAATDLGSSTGGDVPVQQVRAGRSGFDGLSYFESSGRASHRDQSLLHPPPITGPTGSAADVLAKTLEALKPLQNF